MIRLKKSLSDITLMSEVMFLLFVSNRSRIRPLLWVGNYEYFITVDMLMSKH